MSMKEFVPNSVNVKDMMDSAKIARAKSKIVSSACGQVVKLLNEITGSNHTKIAKSNTDGLKGDRLFTGIMRIEARTIDKGESKTISIPIQIENSVIKSMDKYIVKKKLSAIEPTNSRHLMSDDRMASQISEFKTKEAELAKESEAVDKESKILNAKEIEVPSQVGNGNTPDKDMVKSMEYEKVNLPDATIGDIITIGSKVWKIEGEVPNAFGQAESSKWQLVLQEGK